MRWNAILIQQKEYRESKVDAVLRVLKSLGCLGINWGMLEELGPNHLPNSKEFLDVLGCRKRHSTARVPSSCLHC